MTSKHEYFAKSLKPKKVWNSFWVQLFKFRIELMTSKHDYFVNNFLRLEKHESNLWKPVILTKTKTF